MIDANKGVDEQISGEWRAVDEAPRRLLHRPPPHVPQSGGSPAESAAPPNHGYKCSHDIISMPKSKSRNSPGLTRAAYTLHSSHPCTLHTHANRREEYVHKFYTVLKYLKEGWKGGHLQMEKTAKRLLRYLRAPHIGLKHNKYRENKRRKI